MKVSERKPFSVAHPIQYLESDLLTEQGQGVHHSRLVLAHLLHGGQIVLLKVYPVSLK